MAAALLIPTMLRLVLTSPSVVLIVLNYFVFCCFSLTCKLLRKHLSSTPCDRSAGFSSVSRCFSLHVHPAVSLLSISTEPHFKAPTPAVADYINQAEWWDDKQFGRSTRRRQKKQSELRLNKLINTTEKTPAFFSVQSQHDYCQAAPAQSNHDLFFVLLMNFSLPAIIILKRPYSKGTADCNEALSKDLVEPDLAQSWGTLHYWESSSSTVSQPYFLPSACVMESNWGEIMPELAVRHRAHILHSTGSLQRSEQCAPATCWRTGWKLGCWGKRCRRSGHPLGSAGTFAVFSPRGVSYSQSHLLRWASTPLCQRLSASLKRTLAASPDYSDWFCRSSSDSKVRSLFSLLKPPVTATW